jgi:hypothetical protein
VAWQPKLPAQFIRPLVRNLLAVIRRDEVDALAWAAAPETLAPFAWLGIAEHVEPRYPYCLVLADGTDVEGDSDATGIQERHQLVVQLAVTGNDPDALADELFMRVNAVDSIIRQAAWPDLLEGVPWGGYGPTVLEAGRHNYNQFGRRNANQQYMHVGQISVVVAYLETKEGVL